MKLDLALSTDYCPSWGPWEGMRDLLQNYLDGCDKGYRGSMEYSPSRRVLTISNAGARLPREAMLMGFSTKRDDPSQRGGHGEGLKLAMLALLRSDMKVTIRSGEEKLTPRLEWSKKFHAETLHVEVTRADLVDGIKVNVWNLSPEDWNLVQSRFLNFRGSAWKEAHIVSCDLGDLITDPKEAGNLYSSGIFVCKLNGFSYGYNINNLKLDRDRSLPDNWDLQWATAQLVGYGLSIGRLPGKSVLDRMLDGAVETSAAPYTFTPYQRDILGNAFKEEYGSDAVPVASLDCEIADKVRVHGGHPVRVPQNLLGALPKAIGAPDFIESKSKAISSYVGYDDMESAVRHRCMMVADFFRSLPKKIEVHYVIFSSPGASINAQNSEEGPGGVVFFPYFLVPQTGERAVPRMIALIADALVKSGVLTAGPLFEELAAWKMSPSSATYDDSMTVILESIRD